MYKHLTQFELYYVWKHCVDKSTLECFSKKLKVSEVSLNLQVHRSTIYRAISYINKTKWQPIGISSTPKFRKRKARALKKVLRPMLKCTTKISNG